MRIQNKKIIISLLFFVLLSVVLSFGYTKAIYGEEGNDEFSNSMLMFENTTSISQTREEEIAEKVYPEIEISTSIPESKATEEQSSKDEAIFEEDDKDFIPPPVAESE